MTIILLILNIPHIVYTQELHSNIENQTEIYNNTNNINSINIIGDTLKQYFLNNLKSEKALTPLTNNLIDKKSLLATVNKLQYKLKAQINKHYNLKLEYYDNIQLSESNTYYKSSNNINSYYEYIQQQKNSLINKINNLYDYFNSMENTAKETSKTYIANSRQKYNRNASVRWALKNVNSKEDYPNNDCTNYVSKALYQGGIPKDNIWRPGYYAWIRVKNFFEWISPQKGYAQNWLPYYLAQDGDVIQLYNKNKGCFTHSLIVTGRATGVRALIMPTVSAHSDPHKNVPLSNYLCQPQYTQYRLLNIIY